MESRDENVSWTFHRRSILQILNQQEPIVWKNYPHCTYYPNLNTQSIVGSSNIYYFSKVILTYTRAPFNTHVQCAPGQLENEWSVVINVVCGSTENVTHAQKTLAMICLIFADLAKTIRMTLLTIFGSSSPLQMIALQMIKLYPRKHEVI